VIRCEQQLGRVGERLVPGEPLRIGVAVRADDRQVRHFLIQPLRDAARGSVGGKQPVLVKLQCLGHGSDVAVHCAACQCGPMNVPGW
jgi:hypothetical protein